MLFASPCYTLHIYTVSVLRFQRVVIMPLQVLVLYDSHGPHIVKLAKSIAEGIRQIGKAQPLVRHIDEVVPEELTEANALILGSPNWSGISGFLKRWLDDQGDLWEEGILQGKIGAAFTTGRGQHSGLEFTLLELLHWMLAAGMVVVGLPWNDRMHISGSYYGATAVGEVTKDDLLQAEALGSRVAKLSLLLTS